MGIDLESASGQSFSCSGTRWASYLALARELGWQPSLTLPTESNAEWFEAYLDTAGQRITSQEAASIADALALALRDPRLEMMLRRIRSMSMSEDEVWKTIFEGEREVLIELEDFCRAGSFSIL